MTFAMRANAGVTSAQEFTGLALYARGEDVRSGFRWAAGRIGLSVVDLTPDPSSVAAAVGPGTAIRAPGGLLASAMAGGAAIRLAGPTPRWFADLGADVTRSWLPIDSEYRIYTCALEVTASSPYRVQDEPWSILLPTHRASFHDEAARWTESMLTGLGADLVPRAGVFDVARLESGRFVLLEVSQSWAAGLYGCDPAGALRSVPAANSHHAPGPDDRWLWRPDQHLRY